MSLIYRVRVASSGWLGGPGLNTFYFQNATDPSIADSTNAALCVAGVHAAFDASKGAYSPSTSIQVSGVVDVLTAETGQLSESYAGTEPAVITGLGTGGLAPTATMIVGRLNTAGVVNGKRVRGRGFFGPLKNIVDADGSPAADLVNAIGALVNYLHNTVDAAVELVVWSRPVTADSTATPPIVGRDGSAHAVTSTSVRDIFAVLRSRRD